MTFNDTYFSRENYYSIGIETDSGQHYLSIPVNNGRVDYEEYYAISPEHYRAYLEHPNKAEKFADDCRKRTQDSLLIIKPGPKRGEAVFPA